MVNVTFRHPDGRQDAVQIEEGVSVMQGALHAGVEGIDADCGGQISCGTCQVHVDDAWLGKLPPISADERGMLDLAIGVDERSRLSCQLICSAALDGLIVDVPDSRR